MSKKKVIQVLMTDYKIDSRVRNETNSLNSFGYGVIVCCLFGKGLKRYETREGVQIRRFGFGKNRIVKYITAYIHMFVFLAPRKIDIIHAHDLTALPVSVLISKTKGIPVIYDSHELWSRSHHGDHPRWTIKLLELFEKIFAKRCDLIISVSDGIANYLKTYLKVDKVKTIRNIPSYTQAGNFNYFREQLLIHESTPIFLYQGLISESRGVDVFLNAAIEISKTNNAAFVFMGNGPYVKVLQEKIRSIESENIYYKESVSQDELLKYTNSADVGIHAIKNSCLNHDFCLPNKLFEYMSSGIPVLVSELTEMKKFVDRYGLGLCFTNDSVADLTNKIRYLIDNPEKLKQFKVNAEIAAKTVTWDSEAKFLEAAYLELLD